MLLQYNRVMKTATLPALRVEPVLRQQVEQVLQTGESLSSFVESAVRQGVHNRLAQQEFVARGLASLSAARSGKGLLSAQESAARLQRKLDQARKAHAEKSGKNRT